MSIMYGAGLLVKARKNFPLKRVVFRLFLLTFAPLTTLSPASEWQSRPGSFLARRAKSNHHIRYGKSIAV